MKKDKPAPFGRLCPLSAVLVDHDWNCRESIDPAELQYLAETMKRGQRIPIKGVPTPNGRIRLVSGFRRYEAAKLAGMATIWCEEESTEGARTGVSPREGDRKVELELVVAMGAENMARVELTSFEKAQLIDRVWRLMNPENARPYTVYDQMVADALGRSREAVSQYRLLWGALHPEVKAAWRDAPGVLSVNLLQSWASLKLPEQKMALDRRMAAVDDGEALDGDVEPRGRGGRNVWKDGQRASRSKIRAALSALAAGDFDLRLGAWCEGAQAALGWVLGDNELKNEGERQTTLPLTGTRSDKSGRPGPVDGAHLPLGEDKRLKKKVQTPPAFAESADRVELDDVPDYPDTSLEQKIGPRGPRKRSPKAAERKA